jgi:hypothetical protein
VSEGGVQNRIGTAETGTTADLGFALRSTSTETSRAIETGYRVAKEIESMDLGRERGVLKYRRRNS